MMIIGCDYHPILCLLLAKGRGRISQPLRVTAANARRGWWLPYLPEFGRCGQENISQSEIVSYQGTTSQVAEELVFVIVSYQGMTSQAAKELAFVIVSYQGMTSVVP
jgi:hypothetical protein